MTKTKCPACGRDAEGRFCSWCGASLGGVRCSSCGAEGEPGGRFCNACGAPLGAAAGPGAGGAASGGGRDSRLVWGIAGVLLVALILAVGLPMVRGGEESGGVPSAAVTTPAPAQSQGQATGAPDLSQMTPRQAAERLYERIMSTASAGDSAGAAFFIPMGIDAYEMARPLDADGLFHLSLLQRMAGDPEAGLATAREALAVHPNHLLNLASAGGAAAELGDTAAAREYYQAFLDSYDAEMAKGLPEYGLHREMMPELRQDAESLLEG